MTAAATVALIITPCVITVTAVITVATYTPTATAITLTRTAVTATIVMTVSVRIAPVALTTTIPTTVIPARRGSHASPSAAHASFLRRARSTHPVPFRVPLVAYTYLSREGALDDLVGAEVALLHRPELLHLCTQRIALVVAGIR